MSRRGRHPNVDFTEETRETFLYTAGIREADRKVHPIKLIG